jgi:hypothetical protein
MGKIFQSAEVPRVYCGSFREEPLQRKEFEKLFERDRLALMSHLSDLPKMCGMRKVNEMVKRIRLNIVNVCIIGYLQSKMPYFWGHEEVQKKLIETLEKVYLDVRHTYHLPEGDFPQIDEFRGVLHLSDFRQFPKLDRKVLNQLKELLSHDIPVIFKSIAGVTSNKISGDDDSTESTGADNKNLEALLKFDFHGLDKDLNAQLFHTMIPFLAAVLCIILAIGISYLFDGGQSLRYFIARIRGYKSN